MSATDAKSRRSAALHTPTDLTANATQDVAAGLNLLLADAFALYLKTKNFHWHMSGPHFRDYHLLLDEQSDQIAELREDNLQMVKRMRETHGLCDEHGDIASASLLENWIDEAERRVWFLFETNRRDDAPGG